MKRFLSFFYTDVQWKILSLGLAFLLWFVSSIMNDPVQNMPFNFLPLQLHNVGIVTGADLVILNEDALDTTVQVVVHAARSELEALMEAGAEEQLSRIVPSVDFRAINAEAVLSSDGPVTFRLYINANLYAGLTHTSIQPRFIDVQVDAIERRVFPVTADVLNEVGPNFELRPVRLVNNSVTVTGPRTVLATVDSVLVDVDVSGVQSDMEMGNLPLVVLDHNGRDITERVELSVRETTAIVPVWPVHTVELRVQGTGSVATGFAVAAVDIEPVSIDVIGPPELLQELEYLLIQADLDGANDSFTKDVDLKEWLPNGIFLHDGQDPNATLLVTLDPIIRRTFQIPRDDIRVRGATAMYHILSDALSIRIDVAGPSTLVSELNYTEIGLELDLRRLPIGVHDVALTVHLPQGITTALGVPPLQVQIHEPADDDGEEDYDHYHVDPALTEPQIPVVIPNDEYPEPGDDDYNENGYEYPSGEQVNDGNN